MRSRGVARSGFFTLFLVLYSVELARAQSPPLQAEPALPWAEETVEVDLRTVAFYAVDGDGHPVHDLRANEVRLSIDGKPVPFEVFAPQGNAADSAARTNTAAAPVQGTPRHVFLLLDVLFSSPGGLLRAKLAGEQFARQLGPKDRLHLIVNRRSGGFLEVLGPVDADETGLAALTEAMDAVLPDVGSVRANLGDDIPEPLSGARHGNDNIKVARWMIGDMGRAEYRAAAEDLADGLSALATRLGRETGPKLLVMLSGGINPELYFHGWERLGTGSSYTSNYQSGFRPQSALLHRFEAPLKALAEAGIQAAFVEIDRPDASGQDAMAHFGEATGGLFLDGMNAADAAARLARSTSALYEVGWYAGLDGAPFAGRVDLESLRPGVELWATRFAGSRTVARKTGPEERRFLIVDLVSRGQDPSTATSSSEAVLNLTGTLGARPSGATKAIVFAPTWPEPLQSRGAELWDVLLQIDRPSGKMSLLRLERSLPEAAEMPAGLTPRLEGEGPFVWGIVAIDRDTGTTWLRRFMLESPRVDAAASPTAMRR